MSNAARDENNIPTLTAVLDSDGATIVRVNVVDVSGEQVLGVDDDTTGSDNGPDRALRDENFVTTLIGVSSADGVTPWIVTGKRQLH